MSSPMSLLHTAALLFNALLWMKLITIIELKKCLKIVT